MKMVFFTELRTMMQSVLHILSTNHNKMIQTVEELKKICVDIKKAVEIEAPEPTLLGDNLVCSNIIDDPANLIDESSELEPELPHDDDSLPMPSCESE